MLLSWVAALALGHACGRVAAVQAGCWGMIIARGCKQDAPPCCHLSLLPQLLSCTLGCCTGPSPASGGTTEPQLSACGWLWGCFERPTGWLQASPRCHPCFKLDTAAVPRLGWAWKLPPSHPGPFGEPNEFLNELGVAVLGCWEQGAGLKCQLEPAQ